MITVNMVVMLGIFLFSTFSSKAGHILYTGILFFLSLAVFVIAEWFDNWSLTASKRISYVVVASILTLKVFGDSEALMLMIVVDIVIVDVLFNRYVSAFRKNQNRLPMYLISVAMMIVFVDEVYNNIGPNLYQESKAIDLVIYMFVVLKMLFASAILYAESRRTSLQRFKEEQFIDYSADFNNFFSHYINTPLTTAISNVEIVKYKLSRKIDESAQKMVDQNFDVITEGLDNISKTTKELANIHYIRSEVLRSGADSYNAEKDITRIAAEYGADLELVIDEWPITLVPEAMVEFTMNQIIKNATKYAEAETKIRVVVHEERDYLVISTFNKGNIPEFEVDILQPFQRGENTKEGTGTGLGLSLVMDLTSDFNCVFTLSNVGAFTRSQLKLPLENSENIY